MIRGTLTSGSRASSSALARIAGPCLIGASVIIGLTALGQEPPGQSSHREASETKWRAVRKEESTLMDEILRITAPLRKNSAHPDWENLTSQDVEVLVFDRRSSPLDSAVTRCGWEVRYVEFRRQNGRRICVAVDPTDTTVRLCQSLDVAGAIEADLNAGRLPEAKLTSAEALETAKAYVREMVGCFPNDLVPTYFRRPLRAKEGGNVPGYPDAGLGLWTVQFTRYAGRKPYDWQGIEVSFSERYGVAVYVNSCFDAWEGKIAVTDEDALRIAAEQVDAYFREHDADLQLGGQDVALRLRRPPYVKEGTPRLAYVDANNPRAVHAVWVTVFPYACEPEKPFAESSPWGELTAYVDAETGRFLILFNSFAGGRSWKPN
jgi:hypothetical protein